MSKSLYRKFHHENPDKIEKIDLEFPKELVKLGVVTAIEYKASAPSKFTDGAYRHDFKKKPILACDKNGVLYIIRVKITSRGIEDR